MIFQPASVVLLETNLDDAPGLVLGYAQERLFALGALDVWHTPVQMKKNRPGAVLSALVPPQPGAGRRGADTAGNAHAGHPLPVGGPLRGPPPQRHHRNRAWPGQRQGQIDLEGSPVSAAPEPDDCRRIAIETGLPFQEVYQRA